MSGLGLEVGRRYSDIRNSGLFSPTAIQTLREARISAFINKYNDKWFVTHSDSLSYSGSLGYLLEKKLDFFKPDEFGNRSIFKNLAFLLWRTFTTQDAVKTLIRTKQAENANLLTLDLMSYGALQRKLGIMGCALALTDPRTDQEKQLDAESNRVLVSGDILSPKPWRSIRAYLKKHPGVQKFGIILSDPVGALENIPANIAVQGYIFNKVYPLLSSEGGVFLTACHEFDNPSIKKVIRGLNNIPGIRAEFDPGSNGFMNLHPTFLLIKYPEAPEKLPPLKLQD